jgi:TPR repeat protein
VAGVSPDDPNEAFHVSVHMNNSENVNYNEGYLISKVFQLEVASSADRLSLAKMIPVNAQLTEEVVHLGDQIKELRELLAEKSLYLEEAQSRGDGQAELVRSLMLELNSLHAVINGLNAHNLVSELHQQWLIGLAADGHNVSGALTSECTDPAGTPAIYHSGGNTDLLDRAEASLAETLAALEQSRAECDRRAELLDLTNDDLASSQKLVADLTARVIELEGYLQRTISSTSELFLENEALACRNDELTVHASGSSHPSYGNEHRSQMKVTGRPTDETPHERTDDSMPGRNTRCHDFLCQSCQRALDEDSGLEKNCPLEREMNRDKGLLSATVMLRKHDGEEDTSRKEDQRRRVVSRADMREGCQPTSEPDGICASGCIVSLPPWQLLPLIEQVISAASICKSSEMVKEFCGDTDEEEDREPEDMNHEMEQNDFLLTLPLVQLGVECPKLLRSSEVVDLYCKACCSSRLHISLLFAVSKEAPSGQEVYLSHLHCFVSISASIRHLAQSFVCLLLEKPPQGCSHVLTEWVTSADGKYNLEAQFMSLAKEYLSLCLHYLLDCEAALTTHELVSAAETEATVKGATNLGILCINGNLMAKNVKRAMKIFGLAAKDYKIAAAQYGVCLYKGLRDSERDDSVEAITYLKLAADQNYAFAQECLAFALDKGHGVPHCDHAGALRYYLLAAEQGSTCGQINAAMMLEVGRRYAYPAPNGDWEIEVSIDKAARLYGAAASPSHGNSREAQFSFALLYAKGLISPSMPFNPTKGHLRKALHLYFRAAEQGHHDACYNLGICMLNGVGCRKNTPHGLYWLVRSQGNL